MPALGTRFAAVQALLRPGVSPVYTVAQMQRALAQDPLRWSGRTVLVWGQASSDLTWRAPEIVVAQIALVDPGRAPGTRPLSLAWGRPDPLLAALRRLPVLSRLVPPPQRPRLGTPALYRLRLCAPRGCPPDGAGAVLLDADPGLPLSGIAPPAPLLP